MRKKAEYLYKGKIYLGVKALYTSLQEPHNKCAENEISYSTFYNRINAGWNIEQSITTPINDIYKRDYKVGGKTFSSLMDLARDAGISYAAAIKRKDRGFTDNEIFYGKSVNKTKENILRIEVPKIKKVRVVIQGQSYESLAKAYNAHTPSVSINSVRGRLKLGWSAEEALEVVTKADGRSNKKITIKL